MVNEKTKRAATEADLSEVHRLLVKYYNDRLETGTVTPAELSSLVKLLKDNNINCDGQDNTDFRSIMDQLPDLSDITVGLDGGLLKN